MEVVRVVVVCVVVCGMRYLLCIVDVLVHICAAQYQRPRTTQCPTRRKQTPSPVQVHPNHGGRANVVQKSIKLLCRVELCTVPQQHYTTSGTTGGGGRGQKTRDALSCGQVARSDREGRHYHNG